MALSLGPLRIAKRQFKKPWSSDPLGQDDFYDAEKRPLAGDDDDGSDYHDSSPSSRATSNSLDPMLQDSRSSLPRRMASAYDDRIPRRKFNRYFTLILGSVVVLFILFLTKLGSRSSQQVEDLHPPPVPFAFESFPFLKRYHGGIRTLVPRSANIPEYPGDEEELRQQILNDTKAAAKPPVEKRQIPEEETKHKLPAMQVFDPYSGRDTSRKECFLDPQTRISIPKLKAFDGCVRGFADHVIGSYDMFGLRNDVCFDRFGRLGPYGLGYSKKWGGSGAGMEGDTEGSDQIWAEVPEVDYRNISWSNALAACADANEHRFTSTFRKSGLHPDHILKIAKRQLSNEGGTAAEPDREAAIANNKATSDTVKVSTSGSGSELSRGPAVAQTEEPAGKMNRTAVIIRTWHDFEYEPETLMYLRALVAELSLASGSEYVVHFLIHVRNNDLPIWTDDNEYQRVLNESLPQEFRGMGTLWSDKQLELIYPGLHAENFRNIHLQGSYRSIMMPLQHFAHQNPEYDFFWNWELDIRYTGHFYHLFNRIGAWAKEQPRKGLWERNARFYVPSVHGSWDDFRQMVRVQTEQGTSSSANMFNSQLNSPASDPNNPSNSLERPIWGPEPPPNDELDLSRDPKPPTSYAKDNYKWGVGEEADLITFNPLFDPENTDWNLEKDVTGYNITDGHYPPRRAAIVTASRLSRRLLDTMHRETAVSKHTMFSEMWAGSCALHHGLKAVYAPHPVFIDRRWPTDYLAAIYNGGRNGASGGARTTAFNDEHQNQFLGVTWYYHAGAPANLWKRWLGYNVDGDGGPQTEVMGEGRMCLPGMLLHPIKNVEMVYEKVEGEEEEKKEENKEKRDNYSGTLRKSR